MKHHFADFLDRSTGHWTITPNRERWRHHFEDVADAPADASILTITKHDRNWECVLDLPNLRELTLHETNQRQLDAISILTSLRTLRITHARPKSLASLANLTELRELVLEYVSGFDDLSPVAALPRLRALHLENLRRVRDFSPLRPAVSLKYLAIDGTFDWKQPVESFDFLEDLEDLEHLIVKEVRVFAPTPIFASVVGLNSLRRMGVSTCPLPLEDFAFLEAKRSDVDGVARPPYSFHDAFQKPLDPDDFRSKMPVDELHRRFPEIVVTQDGRRLKAVPAIAFLLGKGERTVTGSVEKILKRCREHEEKYRALVQKHCAA